MAISFGIEVNGSFISRIKIKEMKFDEVKTLISFVDDKKDLDRIKLYRKNDERTSIYIDNIYERLSR